MGGKRAAWCASHRVWPGGQLASARGSETSCFVAIAVLFYGHCSASRPGFREDAGQQGGACGVCPFQGTPSTLGGPGLALALFLMRGAAGTRFRSHPEYAAVSWPWWPLRQGVVVGSGDDGYRPCVGGRRGTRAASGPRRSKLTLPPQTSSLQEPRPRAPSSSSLLR